MFCHALIVSATHRLVPTYLIPPPFSGAILRPIFHSLLTSTAPRSLSEFNLALDPLAVALPTYRAALAVLKSFCCEGVKHSASSLPLLCCLYFYYSWQVLLASRVDCGSRVRFVPPDCSVRRVALFPLLLLSLLPSVLLLLLLFLSPSLHVSAAGILIRL